MRVRTLVVASVLGVAFVASGALGHQAHDPIPSPLANTPVPLYDNLGDLTYPISTADPLAQRYFDQGLRLTFAFNHAEALRAFREARRRDPNCAVCYWGEAFVLGPHINAPMDEAAVAPAVEAVTTATRLAHHAGPRERALIAALARRYSDDPRADQGALNRAYADAMAETVTRFPEDDEIAVLYVDALMNLSPWDYWEADRRTPKGRIGEAIRTVERVLARNPNHPGAIHLYIHLTEASATPERAEPHANRLAALMPGAGHIVHMASHVFFRVGRYPDSVATNEAAVRADEAYLATVTAEGLYRSGYYPHNLHFVVASAQMAGDAHTALAYATRLGGTIPDAMAAQVGWIQRIKAVPYFAHAQLSPPATILALPSPGDAFPFVKAMWHYARGVALAATGDAGGARREAVHIADLRRGSDLGHLVSWGVPAPDLLRLARHVVEARIAQAEGDLPRAIREFRVAIAIQTALPYMEPPFWYYPVRQSLGATLLEAGEAEQAEQTFRQTLAETPNNGWALFGLMQAQRAQGKDVEAAETRKRFDQAWAGDPNAIRLRQL